MGRSNKLLQHDGIKTRILSPESFFFCSCGHRKSEHYIQCGGYHCDLCNGDTGRYAEVRIGRFRIGRHLI